MQLVDKDNKLCSISSFDERREYKGLYLEELNIVLLKNELSEQHLCEEACAGDYTPDITKALTHRTTDNYIRYSLTNSVMSSIHDYRLPDLKELEYIFSHKNEINDVLKMIKGDQVKGMYWSRTLISPILTWGKSDPDICITLSTMHNVAKIRFVYEKVLE